MHGNSNRNKADAVHVAMQKAIDLIETKVSGQPLGLDCFADFDELTRVMLATVAISGSLVQSFDQPTSDVIEALRLMAMKEVDS